MRIVIPALRDVPQPQLVPQENHQKHKAAGEVDESPEVLAEFIKS